jgi:hypothetical protein
MLVRTCLIIAATALMSCTTLPEDKPYKVDPNDPYDLVIPKLSDVEYLTVDYGN